MIWDSEEPCYKYECVSGSRIRHRICSIPTCDVVSKDFFKCIDDFSFTVISNNIIEP